MVFTIYCMYIRSNVARIQLKVYNNIINKKSVYIYSYSTTLVYRYI